MALNSKLVKAKQPAVKAAQGPVPASLERIPTGDPNYTRQLRAILDAYDQRIKDLHTQMQPANARLPQPGDDDASTPNPTPTPQRQEVFVQAVFPVGLNYPADVFIQTAPGVYAQYVFNPATSTFDLITVDISSAFVPTLLEANRTFEIPKNRQADYTEAPILLAGASIIMRENASLTENYRP